MQAEPGAFPWRLKEGIAKGAQSSVWLAEGIGARFGGAQGVVKVLDREHGDAAFAVDQRAARLRHPNLVVTYDAGILPEGTVSPANGVTDMSGRKYIAMEAAGGSYRDNAMGWPAAGYVVMDVLAGLSELHLGGLIHRDVKPANVLWFADNNGDDGARKLCDFSLCAPSSLEELSTWAEREMFAGTPSYMAPEQAQCRWRDLGPWTDIYGVGCLLWVLLVGRTPWGKHDKREVLRRQINAPLPPLHTLQPPPCPWWRAADVEHWITRCTTKAPGGRFQTAGEAAMALLPLLTTPERIVEKTPTGANVYTGVPSEAEKLHKLPRIYLTSAQVAAPGPMHPALGDGLTLSVERVPDAVARDITAGNVLALTPTRRGFNPARIDDALKNGTCLPGHMRFAERVEESRVHINASWRAGGHRWVSVPPAKAQQWDGAWCLYAGVVPPGSTLVCNCRDGGHVPGCHLPRVAGALSASGWEVVLDGKPVAVCP